MDVDEITFIQRKIVFAKMVKDGIFLTPAVNKKKIKIQNSKYKIPIQILTSYPLYHKDVKGILSNLVW